MATVWVLYEESGEYSDYSKGIKGVFSSISQAIKWHDAYCEKIIAKIIAKGEAESGWTKQWYEEYVAPRYRGRQAWIIDENNLGHCVAGKSHSGFDALAWTIAPYIVDAPND